MNRIKLIPVTLVALAVLVLTPHRSNGQVQFGLVGGANFASLDDFSSGDNLISLENRTGFHLGAFLDIGSASWGIRPGIYYLNAGPLFEGATFINDDHFDLNYVAIPIDVRFNLGVGPIQPYLITGPEFHLLASGDMPGEIRDNLKSAVVDWSIGAGLAIGMPGSGLVLYPQLRYNFAISDFARNEFNIGGVPVTTDGRVASLWLLSLGIGF